MAHFAYLLSWRLPQATQVGLILHGCTLGVPQYLLQSDVVLPKPKLLVIVSGGDSECQAAAC